MGELPSNLDSLIALSSAITYLLTQQIHSGSTQREDYPPLYDNLHHQILCLQSWMLFSQTQFSQQERNWYEKAIYLGQWILPYELSRTTVSRNNVSLHTHTLSSQVLLDLVRLFYSHVTLPQLIYSAPYIH